MANEKRMRNKKLAAEIKTQKNDYAQMAHMYGKLSVKNFNLSSQNSLGNLSRRTASNKGDIQDDSRVHILYADALS